MHFSRIAIALYHINRLNYTLYRYILRKELTMFGAKVGDIKLMSLSVVKEHCSVKFDATGIYVIGRYCSMVLLFMWSLCECI